MNKLKVKLKLKFNDNINNKLGDFFKMIKKSEKYIFIKDKIQF